MASWKLVLISIFFLMSASRLSAADESSSISKKNSTQQIGGLLFDMDEGAKIEQGPGGSVYVKSNKEYMQQKFADIETRLNSSEARISELENKLKSLAGPGVKAAQEESPQDSSGRQVLIS